MAELADEWPSLAPIRTSCSSSRCCSSSSSSAYYLHTSEPHTTLSSCSPPLSHPPPRSADQSPFSFQSPPSSASSSHANLLHSSLTSCSLQHTKSHGLLSKCFAPRPSSHAFPKQCISASPCRRPHAAGTAGAPLRSVASVSGGQGARLMGSAMCCSSTSNIVKQYSAQVKVGYNSNACRSHIANMSAFTMMPANVVGKKKPPDYLSDEPTSPEVTCIGRVRKSKHSKSTWDALLNSSEKLCKQKKAPKKHLESTSARRNLQLAYIPRPMSSPTATSTWNKMLTLFKDIRGLHSPYLQRNLRQADLVIDLNQLHTATCGAADRYLYTRRIDEREMCDAGNRILYICQAGEGEVEESTRSQEEGERDHKHIAEAEPLAHPNCLTMMRNMSGRSKVFHNHDDNSGSIIDSKGAGSIALKGDCASRADEVKRSKKQASSLWKSKKLFFSSSRPMVTR